MNFFRNLALSAAFGFLASAAYATPAYLITHNNTNVESNAFVDNVPSPIPTPAHSTGQVPWFVVKLACYGHTKNNRCYAVIKVATNTPNPIDVGMVSMDIDSGDISPVKLQANGYTFTVNGPGEATLSQDNS